MRQLHLVVGHEVGVAGDHVVYLCKELAEVQRTDHGQLGQMLSFLAISICCCQGDQLRAIIGNDLDVLRGRTKKGGWLNGLDFEVTISLLRWHLQRSYSVDVSLSQPLLLESYLVSHLLVLLSSSNLGLRYFDVG